MFYPQVLFSTIFGAATIINYKTIGNIIMNQEYGFIIDPGPTYIKPDQLDPGIKDQLTRVTLNAEIIWLSRSVYMPHICGTRTQWVNESRVYTYVISTMSSPSLQRATYVDWRNTLPWRSSGRSPGRNWPVRSIFSKKAVWQSRLAKSICVEWRRVYKSNN